MITKDFLAGLELFAGIEDAVLGHVAEHAADLHIRKGDYLIHEGEVAAFFILLEGRLELTKRVLGEEQRVTVRDTPGEFLGEVPLLLEGTSVVNVRALEDARVARIEGVDFHLLLANSAKLTNRVMQAMKDHVVGISQLALDVREPLVIVGRAFDTACHDIRDFLLRNRIPFDFIEIDDPLAREIVPEIADNPDRCPIVKLRDGRVLFEPELSQIATEVEGLQIAPQFDEYDVMIIGGGPAGLAAAVYGASEGLRTLMVERVAPGGQAGTSSRIENYLGFPAGLSGDELGFRALQQAKRLGAEIVVTREVRRLVPAQNGGLHEIVFDGDARVRSRSVIVAVGVVWHKLDAPGIADFSSAGVFYGAARSEAPTTRGKDVFLVGAGNSAGQAAIFISGYANTVTLLVRGDSLEKSMSRYLIEQLDQTENVVVETRREVVGAHGNVHLEAIDVRNNETGEVSRRETEALFILIGADAQTGWLPREIARDAQGYIVTGADAAAADHHTDWPLRRDPYLLETTVPGIFAAGDVRHGSIKRVASGVGEGSMAIAFTHQYLAEKGR